MKKLLIILVLILGAQKAAFGQWVQTNGPYGGDVTCLVETGTSLLAGTPGGIFRSTDNGTSWRASNEGLTEISIYALAVNGSNIYAGTYGGGVFLSTNDGETWNASMNGLPNTNAPVCTFAVSGSNLFVGLGDAVIGGNGVYLSNDSGKSWKSVINNIADTVIQALAVSGTNLFAGTTQGIFISTNDGKSWALDTNGMSYNNITALAISGSNIFAGTYEYGVYKSTNSGGSWTSSPNESSNLFSSNIQTLMTSGTKVFVGTGGGIFLSVDSGKTWTLVVDSLTNLNIQAISMSGSNLFVGTLHGGVSLSTNNGSSWSERNNGLSATVIYSFASNGTDLFVGTQGGTSLSTDNGMRWTEANLSTQNGSFHLSVLAIATNGNNIYAGTGGGGVFLSTNSGESWTMPDVGPMDNSVTALVIIGDTILAGGSEGVSFSTNNGNNWTVESGVGSNVKSFAEIGINIFEESSLGVFLSTDNGVDWTATKQSLIGKRVSCLAAVGTNLFVGTSGNGILRSSDTGGNWTPVNTGLTGNALYIITFAVVGSNLFVSTGDGVFLSTDSGENWKAINSGLMGNYVQALFVSGPYLYAGTYGSGVWRLPLADFGITAAVAPDSPISNSIQSYPNPLSQSTTIRFTSAESGVARVTVVNLLGEEVARVFEGALTSGEHSFLWGKPTGLPDGMYECVVQMNGSVQQVPMVVMSEP